MQPCYYLHKVPYQNTHSRGYEVLPYKCTLRCVVPGSDYFPLNSIKKFSRLPQQRPSI